MDEFVNTVDSTKFRATNSPWNELCLNDPWSVGYVSSLIESQNFINKEEWEQFYYNSGQTREGVVNGKPQNEKEILNLHTLKSTNPTQIDRMSWDMKNINQQHGRTQSDLAEKGQILFNKMQSLNVNISLEECIECVRFRVICETWNGIILRERNTVATLKRHLPNLEFRKASGEFDHAYAVDYEIYNNGTLVCGIQIKPQSYTYNMPYIVRARNANRVKNESYRQEFGKPVFDVISQSNGTIVNQSVLQEIQNQM